MTSNDARPSVRNIGAGISSLASDGILVQWLYSYEDDEPVRLRAVVVLQAQGSLGEPIASDAGGASPASPSESAFGYALGPTNLWIGIDHVARTVRCDDAVVAWPPDDEILAFTIERADHVGGLPVRVQIALPAPPRPAHRPASFRTEVKDWSQHLRSFAARAPFLRHIP